MGGLALVALMLPASAAAAPTLKLEARLTGNSAASGKAKFEERTTRRKFSIEVEGAARNLPLQMVIRRGTQSQVVAMARTNQFGFVDVNGDTALGQFVPVLKAGDIVEVRTASGVLLRGTLQPR